VSASAQKLQQREEQENKNYRIVYRRNKSNSTVQPKINITFFS
jgi:hypothetical protein